MKRKIGIGPRAPLQESSRGFTTHKERAQWFQERASFPLREASMEKLARARGIGGRSTHEWRSLGPTNVSGRLTSIAVDPRDPMRLFVGAAGGGVWRSKDGGKKWETRWDKLASLNIGSLAIDPQSPDNIYCGTGEANLSADSYPGSGVYRSTDGGNSWKIFSRGDEKSVLFPRRFGALAVDPFANGRTVLFAGSVRHDDADSAGLIVCDVIQGDIPLWHFITDFISPESYRCHSVVIHKDSPGLVFAAINARGVLSGIWKSEDHGDKWRQLSKGLPPGERFGRTSLAVTAADPSFVYALVESREGVLGVFQSKDFGESWQTISDRHFNRERQAYYNNCIAVDPEHPEWVYCGLVNLHRTKDGGKNWEQITEWRLPLGDPRFAHSDHHALAIPETGLIYDANDGGLDVSTDGGDTWENRSSGLVTTMFYDVDVAPSDGEFYGGGAQDNGTLVHQAGNAHGEFDGVLGADGGWMIFAPDDPGHLWASSQHMSLKVNNTESGWADVTPFQATEEEREKVWLAFLAMDMSEGRANPRTVFAGSTRIWKTVDDGSSWEPVSEALDGSAISAIEVASANPRFVYAGTHKGGFYRSIDGGNNWSENLGGPHLPGRIITRIESHPKDATLVMMTIGVTPVDRMIAGSDENRVDTVERGRHSHVFVSMDAGSRWQIGDPGTPNATDLDQHFQLPDVPHNSLTFETRPPCRVFVATDIGVFEGRSNQGKKFYHWSNISGNLPNVMVTDIVYHELTHTLTIGTYGRGLWRLKLDRRKNAVKKRAKTRRI